MSQKVTLKLLKKDVHFHLRSLSRPSGLTWQPHRSCPCRRRSESPGRSVHPLLKEVALLQLRIHAGRRHGRVLGEVLGILPLEELHAVLRVRLAAEVAIRGRNLVFRLTTAETSRWRPGGSR